MILIVSGVLIGIGSVVVFGLVLDSVAVIISFVQHFFLMVISAEICEFSFALHIGLVATSILFVQNGYVVQNYFSILSYADLLFVYLSLLLEAYQHSMVLNEVLRL